MIFRDRTKKEAMRKAAQRDGCPERSGSSRRSGRPAGFLCAILAAVMLTGCSAVGTAYTDSGFEALDDGDPAKAQADFREAIDRGEDAVEAWRGLGIAYFDQADYENALSAFNEALRSSDDRMPETVTDLLLYKVLTQYRLKDYSGAIATADILTEQAPENPDGYFYRGASCLAAGDLDKAKVNFDTAVQLRPNDYELYLNIYNVYKEANRSGVGDEYLETALGITPSDNESWYRIGEIYYDLEQYDKAQEALNVPVNDSYLPALALVGQIYLAKGDYDNGKATYLKIQSLAGETQDSYNGLALCALAQKNPAEALEYIEKGLPLSGNESRQQLLFNRIVAYERQNDYANALKAAQDYVAAYPTDEAGQKELTFLSTRVE